MAFSYIDVYYYSADGEEEGVSLVLSNMDFGHAAAARMLSSPPGDAGAPIEFPAAGGADELVAVEAGEVSGSAVY
jgi:hypothetical protein